MNGPNHFKFDTFDSFVLFINIYVIHYRDTAVQSNRTFLCYFMPMISINHHLIQCVGGGTYIQRKNMHAFCTVAEQINNDRIPIRVGQIIQTLPSKYNRWFLILVDFKINLQEY